MYETSDFYLASALRSFGYKMKTNKIDPKRVVFQFEGEGIDDKVSEYWDHTLQVKAWDFVQSIKELKTRIYNL